ncbi:MAG: FHA domain-containing protein [Polyangiaceae bacterium]
MPISVLVRSGEVDSPPELSFDAPRVVIGRGDGCEVRLPDPSVSHRHASIRQRGADYIVVDEGSTNGTFVGSVRLGAQSPRVLRSGDVVRVGRVWLEVQIKPVAPQLATPNSTKELALALVANALSSQGEDAAVKLQVYEGADSGRELVLGLFEHRYVIGRGKSVDLAFDDEDASRRHCELIRRGDKVFVRDLNSKNGTFLDGQQLVAERETRWPAQAILSIGSNRMRFEDPVALALEELERAADEHMSPDDSVDPPDTIAPKEETPPPDSDALSDLVRDARSSGKAAASSRAAAPIAQRPKKDSRLETTVRTRRPKPGWGKTDFIVAAVAIGVLTLSVIGMLLLLRSG